MTAHNRRPAERPGTRHVVPERDIVTLARRSPGHRWRSPAAPGFGLAGCWLTLTLVCAAPARPDRLPIEATPKLQVPAGQQPLPAIALKSGIFLPVGRVDRNLTDMRKPSRGGGGVHAIALFDSLPTPRSRHNFRPPA